MNFHQGRWAVLVALGLIAVAGPHVSGHALAQEQTAEEENPVLATVNGDEIRRSDALRALGRVPAQMRQLPQEQILPVLVNVIIDTRLLADEAEEQGLADDPEVQQQLEFARNVVLEQMLLNRYLGKQITEDALRERYQELAEDTGDREQVHARHILVEDEAEAKDAIAKLDEGADFAEVAEEMSTGPSGSSGGDLGYFSRGDMIPAFADAAFALEPGTYTKEPVKTEFGWHVIKVEDRKTAEPPAFEEVEGQIRQQLAMDLRSKYLNDLREQADIERFDQPETEAGEGEGTSGDGASTGGDEQAQ